MKGYQKLGYSIVRVIVETHLLLALALALALPTLVLDSVHEFV